MTTVSKKLKLYPIQAANIGARELHIKANLAPSDSIGVEDEAEFDLSTGHSDYDPENKVISIAVKIEVGAAETNTPASDALEQGVSKATAPFHLKIELIGIFVVDDTVFPADRVYEWAKTNAIFIMYPYLREHVFALTARMGFKPMLLPLVEVPLFNIPKESPSPVLEPTPQQN